jgi:hypothetical protein
MATSPLNPFGPENREDRHIISVDKSIKWMGCSFKVLLRANITA